MAFKLTVLIALTVFIKHDVLCFQPAFTDRKKLVLPIRGHDQWRNKRTQLQMHETTQIYDVCRRMVRGSKYAVSTILFTKSMKSKLIALAHTLFVFIFLSCIASIIHYIPQFVRDIPWVSIRKIFDESNLKRKQWISDMNLSVKPTLDNFKTKFSASMADLINVMNRAGDQTSSLRIGMIADVVNVSGKVMEKSHVLEFRSFEYKEERDTVMSHYFEENITNIDGISYTSTADISGDYDTSMGTNSELEEILKHSKILIGCDEYDNNDEYNRSGNVKERNLSTSLPLNHGNGGYGIEQYHTLSTPLFLTTTPLAQIETLQLTPVAYILESRDAVASLQPSDPLSALIPTFYSFSSDDNSVFAASSFLLSPSSCISDKVESDPFIVLDDKGIDIGLIGMTSADHTNEAFSLDYLPLISPQELSLSHIVFDHIPDDKLPHLMPHLSLDVTTPSADNAEIVFSPDSLPIMSPQELSLESSNSETANSLTIGSPHESHKDASRVVHDKVIDVGLIGVTSADRTGEISFPGHLPLMASETANIVTIGSSHESNKDGTTDLLPFLSIVTPDVTTPFNLDSSNSEIDSSSIIDSSHELHQDGSKASLQSSDPPSALIPTFYPFSSDDDSLFIVSSFLPSSPSSTSDKVERDQSMKESVRTVEALEQQLVNSSCVLTKNQLFYIYE